MARAGEPMGLFSVSATARCIRSVPTQMQSMAEKTSMVGMTQLKRFASPIQRCCMELGAAKTAAN